MNLHEEFKLFETMWDGLSKQPLKEFGPTATPNAPAALTWEDLLVEADKLLAELCAKSGNGDWDDGDGYWQEEYTVWCNRNIYYTKLADTTKLEVLCADYSKKLPNVEFYFYDDEQDGISEIGYIATRAEESTFHEDAQTTDKTLKEAVDPVAALHTRQLSGAPWYTQYFAVGPAVYEKASGDVFTPEDFDDDWTDFEAAYSDTANYDILPIVFGPHMNRTYTNEQFDTLEDALDNVITNFYRDSDLSDINTYQGLFDNALMNKTVKDDATFIVAYAPDVQDAYGCFMRVSQKPLGSNKQLAKHYFKQLPKYGGPHMLAELLDTGIVGDAFSDAPNFAKSKYAWQAK